MGDEQEKAAIGVLARKKINKDRQDAGQPPLTQEQVDSNPEMVAGALAGLNLSDPKQLAAIGDEEGAAAINLLSKKKKEREGGQQQQPQNEKKGCPPSDGVFHAYAVEAGNSQNRYALTFANPKAADDFAAQLKKDYPNQAKRKYRNHLIPFLRFLIE